MSFITTVSTWSRRAPSSVASPPAIPQAISSVPVSMRSPMISLTTGTRSSTPSTVMVEVPAPWISAPMRLSMSARSVISGSRAAFSITVSPLASTAAVSRFSVAPTLGNSSTTRAPREPVGARLDEAVHDVELDAHRLEAAEVHVELAAADVVAAGHRDARLAAARQQRTEHVDRRAHAGHELVGRLGVQRRRRVDLQLRRARPLDVGADGAQHVDHHVEVGDGIEVAQRRDPGREQRGRHLLGARVLGRARDADRAAEADDRRGRRRSHSSAGTHRTFTPRS